MKKLLYLLVIIILQQSFLSQITPFNKGVNLTGWFQVNSPTEIHFTKYTKQDFENIKSLGADVIRLPINLHSMTLGSPNYELDPLFLKFLDQAIDWAEELELHLILDNHTFDPATSTDPNIGDILIPVWQNMAEHFKNRSNLIYYEILNEPHGIADNTWNTIQQSVITAIREIDSVHTIIVGPAGWNSYNNLKYMPVYEDDNLIYTFHFYDPFLFTHQGASWTDPSLVSLSGMPFPYNAANMPQLPNDLVGTWVEGAFNNYNNDGTIGKVREMLDIAIDFKTERNVPIFCGEFGVYIPNSNNTDRVLWYNVVRNYLELNGIAWTTWDYHGGFGLFKQNGYGLFEHDLNTNLLAALGFNVPPQSEFELKPDSAGFGIYTDYIESKIVSSGYTSGVLNFYNVDSYTGDYCISWSNPSQYNSIGFKFMPIKDFSYLSHNNYFISFWIKGSNPLSKFEIRFLDTKENEEDHPWRMSYTVDHSVVDFDNQWQYVEIPLSSFNETGSWDDAWYNPQGLFNWSAVEIFEIVDEFGMLSNSQLWFDEIKIYDPNSTNVEEENLASEFHLYQNYPNPFNPTTAIKFTIPNVGTSRDLSLQTKLIVYDILGREVATLVNKELHPGNHEVKFNASNLSSGVYFYKLQAADLIKTRKLLLMK
ncbi:MAG: cellulase family glycosylhydrolase [Melioribacteraceae bacterium]|nr:MAG: cellulase family glycosylhydrolase [Melioribacteraceae bacterium]